MAVTIKSQREIELMRESCKILADVFSEMEKAVHPGVSTLDINNLGEKLIRAHGCIPNFLNYNGYPASICVSVNDEVVHGIPSRQKIIQEGDLVKIDAGLIYKGYHSDAARTYAVGEVSPEAERIVRVTKECVELGLKAAKPWGHLGDIAYAINSHAQENGYSVVEEIGGHGIGLEFHEEPFVSYVTPKGSEMVLVPGMMFTIEPMINQGSPEFYVDEDNGWTVYTDDDGLSAQIEYMVLIKEDGVEVLTK